MHLMIRPRSGPGVGALAKAAVEAAASITQSPQRMPQGDMGRAPGPLDFLRVEGPFDVIGDVHGCGGELKTLLSTLGYPDDFGPHPQGRVLVFVGDLVDRGPDSPGVLRRAMSMGRRGAALCVMGNHEHRLLRHLRGHAVKATYGLDRTLAQLAKESPTFLAEVKDYLAALPAHTCLHGGALVVAHAGLPLSLHGLADGRARSFAMYGPGSGALPADDSTGGENWPDHYQGDAYVVHGHHPTQTLAWRGRVLNLDTGCVFGGRLSALRYPEMTLTSVPAEQVWEPRVRWQTVPSR